MTVTVINMKRRDFLQASLATSVSLLSAKLWAASEPDQQSPVRLDGKLHTSSTAGMTADQSQTATHSKMLYSASTNPLGINQLSQWSLDSQHVQHFAIPFRAHDVLPMPDHQRVIAFGRRPEMQCVVVDIHNQQTTPILATEGRHFYGHGCLSADNSTLFTTENEYDEARGVIGIRDAKTLQVIGEYDTYGVGPHDIHLMPDGKTLVVANGGIETHPDYGRRKLNLETMQPSLVYIDVENGQKLAEYRLDDHQLSIRHLSVSDNGDVGVATQFQGDLYRRQPSILAAWQPSGGELEALPIAEQTTKAIRGYMADLAFDPKQNVLAVTAPQGNQLTLWDLQSKQLLSTLAIPEPSGISYLAESECFLVSSAKGGIYEVHASRQKNEISQRLMLSDIAWDNHLLVV